MIGGYGRGYYGYGMMDGGWVGLVIMLVFWALVIAAIIMLIVWALRTASGRGGAGPMQPPAPHDEALAIAKRRFASGEITKEQYEEIARALKG